MTYPLHKNETGSFQELAHKSDGIEFGQLSLLIVAPRQTRGGHYHTYKREWFCCIRGECYIALADTTGNQIGCAVLSENAKMFVGVCPNRTHTVLNIGDVECVLLVISSKEYNPDDADTYRPASERGTDA